MQNELETLLRRWAELEPDALHVTPSGSFLFHGGDVSISDVKSDAGPLGNAIIQGAVQEAIEARGWKWSVACTYGAFHFSASVLTRLEDTDWGNTWAGSHDSLGEKPVEALLSAYIAALEAHNADA